jgi:class 3 adenylate cyclase/tetratricopeptide (TPR) repeat protein
MKCAACSHDNRDGAKFCDACGAVLKRVCASCGVELRPAARFCDECGTPMGDGAPPPLKRTADPAGARKIVTVVFADLAGSTALHERVDAESARRLMERYYETLRAAVEVHGGTVVKLLGDGVMAAFGVPQVAEDDAIRAVRAGVAMQDAFRVLMREQAASLGEVALRVAVNTGEVVVSGANDDVVGDPVNVAARLQQEARDGDVVVGEATRRLVSSLVTLEPLGSFVLKGRSEPVAAYRVASLERPAGAAATPFVGREAELARLAALYEAAVNDRATKLAVLLGSPGLGKSRLIDELCRRLGDDATVIGARCDAAGGATFAPIAEALRQFLGIDGATAGDALRSVIESRLSGTQTDGTRIATGVASLLAGTPASPEESFFVIRRLLAAGAADKPVVLVLDDLQWAEPLLLDLVEHLVQWGAGVPLLVLVGARPELRDVRSSLVTPGSLVGEVITLAGLDAGAATKLAAHVIGASDLPAAVAAKVLATSEGNPLFVGELVRMLVQEGVLARADDRWIVGEGLAAFEMPPTIQALLAARIEKLRAEDRTVLEHAAVVGRVFSRGAVAELLPDDVHDLDARLEALRRSELIERDAGWFLGEPMLRFHHVLIRDAAYRRLLKGTRAELHGRFADWIEERVGAALDHDETIGWHLEQAYELLGQLGAVDDKARALGERASRRLAAAGRRALAGDDVSVASQLLGRAIVLLDAGHSARADLALDWCEALLAAGEVAASVAAIDELGRVAEGDARLRAWHTCFAAQRSALTAPESLQATANSVAAAAAVLAELGDAAGEAKAHFTHAQALARLGRVGACEAALDEALAAARNAGDRRRANAVLAGAPLAALWGPSPVTRASGRCLDVVRVLRITQGAPAVEAVALSCQGVLEALRGRTDAARRMVATARKMVEELGISHRLFETDVFAARIDLMEGDSAAAERTLRSAYDGLRDLGIGTDAAQTAALLGRALLAQGRAAEAEALSHEAEALAGDDLKAAIAWRGVRAEALAARGETDAAVELARAAVGIASATDALLDHADACLALAAALRAAGRGADADAEEHRARELWEAKGATLLAGRSSAEPVDLGVAARAAAVAATMPAVQRRVRPNAMSALLPRIATAIRERDIEAIDAWLGDRMEIVEHPTGTTYGREGLVENMRAMMRTPGIEVRNEPLATLGESLWLGHRIVTARGTPGGNFDVADYEMDHVVLNEMDATGRLGRFEVFAPDDLGSAIARMYTRYAELLPEGPTRERAAMTARALTGMLTPSKDVRPEEITAPDIRSIDHRTVGYGTAEGGEFATRWLEAWDELSYDRHVRIDDVLALTLDGLLRRSTTAGTLRATGGAFESTYYLISLFGPDGRHARYEVFDIGHEAEALARFDELTATATAEPERRDVRDYAATRGIERFLDALPARDAELLSAGPSSPCEPDDTRIELFANAATRFCDRMTAAWAERDWDSVWALHRPTVVLDDRRRMLQLRLPADSAVENLRILFEVPESRWTMTPIATRGERLALGRALYEGNVDASGGALEIEYLAVGEVDADGLAVAILHFDLDDLDAAYAELDRRYAAGEGGSESCFFATTAGTIKSRDWEAFGALLADEIVTEEHRRVAMRGTTRGVDEVIKVARALADLAPDSAFRIEHVRGGPRVWLWYGVEYGTRDGGEFEIPMVGVSLCNAGGKVERMDYYDPEQLEQALARFEEARAATTCDESRSDPFANAASRSLARTIRCFNSRDWDGMVATYAPEHRMDDRRKLVRLEIAGRQFFENERWLFELPGAVFDSELIATRGERLALCRVSFRAGGDDTGPMTVEVLDLIEVDANGRRTALVVFDPDDLDAAYAELDRRYMAGENAVPGIVHGFFGVTGAINRRDWDAIPPRLAPGFALHDHRALRLWNILSDAETFIRAQQALMELAPDARYRVDHLRVSDRAHLCQFTQMGTRDGGLFETPFIHVGSWDESGRVRRYDTYDLDQVDQGLARFTELRPDPLRVPSNAADRVLADVQRIRESRGVGALRALVTEDFRFEDHGRRSLVAGGVEEWLRALEFLTDESRGKAETELVATVGERLALHRVLWRDPCDGNRFEIENYRVCEIDDAGSLRAIEVFDSGDRAAAFAALYHRYIRANADRLPPHAFGFLDAWNAHDIDRLRAILPTEFYFDDRRRTGVGRLDGLEAYLASLVALFELSPDVRIEPLYQVADAEHARVYLGRWCGTNAEGGEFESVYVILQRQDADRASLGAEMFEVDDLELALARFEELRPWPA